MIILVYNEVCWGNTVFTCFLLIPNQICQIISTLKSLEVNPSSMVANYTRHIFCWWRKHRHTEKLRWWTGLSDGENTTLQNYIMFIIYRGAGLSHTNKEAGLANHCRSHLCRRERSSGHVCREKAMVNIFGTHCQYPHMNWRKTLPIGLRPWRALTWPCPRQQHTVRTSLALFPTIACCLNCWT